MVDLSNGIGGMMPNVSAVGVLNTIMYVMIGIIVVGIVALITWQQMVKKKYGMYRVEVLDKDKNGNVYKTYDSAGIFLDKKTGNRLNFLRKAKVGLDPNNVPYITAVDKKGRMQKIVTVRRIGVNNYIYVSMTLGETVEVTIGEEDLNNAAQEMNKIRKTYDKKSWLDQYLAPILFIVSILIIGIVLISLFNKFGVIQEASNNMVTVSEKQLQITQLLFNLTNSTQQLSNQAVATIIRPGGS